MWLMLMSMINFTGVKLFGISTITDLFFNIIFLLSMITGIAFMVVGFYALMPFNIPKNEVKK